MTRPAGFWPRYVAWSLDAALVLAAVVPFVAGSVLAAASAFGDDLLQLLIDCYAQLDRGVQEGLPALAVVPRLLDDPGVRGAIAALGSDLMRMAAPALAGYVVVGLVYHVLAESSRWQATIGKRALGLVVVDRDGRRPGPGRVTARYAASALSWLTLNLGHVTAMVPPHRLALHDRISGTRVLAAPPSRPLPVWAWGWLGLQALAATAACVAMTIGFSRLAWQALETALG
ncbi:RDD family protein [Marilutibacter chinensis]|uniref:RDD family protein n=1 Tax=Marilutibacter chinensis TaxID=2912247 RepID=A0ABS9HU98_9GAMM|nr:RDD family protein [Lysobacter chinensis]